MAAFAAVLRLDLEHRYSADTRCRGIRLTPDAATSGLFRRPDLALRTDTHSLSILVDRQSATLDALLADGGVDLRFHARVSATDWIYQSDLAMTETATPPVLHAAAISEQGRMRLHAGDVVTRDDFVDDDGEGDADLRWSPALFSLRLPLRRGSDGETRYVVRFGARSTHWRYNIVGDVTRHAVRIVDLANEETFEPQAPSTLANGRSAIRLRSVDRLALEERCNRHFQLLARDGSGERIVVRRLPVAGIGSLADAGTTTDIFVHSGT